MSLLTQKQEAKEMVQKAIHDQKFEAKGHETIKGKCLLQCNLCCSRWPCSATSDLIATTPDCGRCTPRYIYQVGHKVVRIHNASVVINGSAVHTP